MRTAIGLPDIDETPVSNVESLISSWGSHTEGEGSDKRKISPLGQGVPLPPLPKPRDTYAIVFQGDRWQPKSALLWCKMNGYMPVQKQDLDDRFKLILNPVTIFKRNTFKSVSVCKDIKVLTGVRVSATNERRVRKLLRSAS